MLEVRKPLQVALFVPISILAYALVMLWIGRYRIAVLVKGSRTTTESRHVTAAAHDPKQPAHTERDPVAKPAETCDPVLPRAALTSFAVAVGSFMMASIFVVLRWYDRSDDWPLVLLTVTAMSSLACFFFFEGKRDWLKPTAGTVPSYCGFAINLLSVLVAVQIACQPELLKIGKPPQAKSGWAAPHDQPAIDQHAGGNWAVLKATPPPARAEPAAIAREPDWQPFLLPDQADWHRLEQGHPALMRAMRVRWTGGEGEFRVTSLSTDFPFGTFLPSNGVVWSPDGEQLFVQATDCVWQFFCDDWSAQAWSLKPPPISICLSSRRLLVAQHNRIAFEDPRFVLVDPVRFTPTEEIQFPTGSHIARVCGSPGSKYLFAVDAAGTIILGIDPEQRKITDRKALESVPNLPPFQVAGDLAPRTMALTRDGRKLLYHCQRGLIVFSIDQGRIVGEQAIGLSGNYQRIQLAAHTSQIVCYSRSGTGFQDMKLEVREVGDFSKITASFPAVETSASLDVDPTTGQVLRMENGEFHVFNPADRTDKVLSRPFIARAVKRAKPRLNGGPAQNRTASVFAASPGQTRPRLGKPVGPMDRLAELIPVIFAALAPTPVDVTDAGKSSGRGNFQRLGVEIEHVAGAAGTEGAHRIP